MRLLGLALLLAGCGADPEICRSDGECPSGFHCLQGTGLCERMRSPDAAVPDLGLLDQGND